MSAAKLNNTEAMNIEPVDHKAAGEYVRSLIADQLLGPQAISSHALCLAGPPRSGKTHFAQEALLQGLEAFGSKATAMVVSGRQAAAHISQAVIAKRGASDQPRPVGTIQALAFKVVSDASRLREGQPSAKLLNGAEQDALLRSIMAGHVAHVRSGEDCASCRLLEAYFASQDGWSGIVSVPSPGTDQPDLDHIDANFIAQLRDMLARMTDLGLNPTDQDQLLDALAQQDLGLDAQERLNIQWRLAFALWREYVEEIERAYPGQGRLDPSMLMVAASQAVKDNPALDGFEFVVVDDWQDVTIAGMGFLQALWQQGTRLVLVGNSDQSVQAFRGSYPEFLATRVVQPPEPSPHSQGPRGKLPALLDRSFARLGAVALRLPYRPIVGTDKVSKTGNDRSASSQPASYADLVASRLSLSILDQVGQSLALPQRPGKLPAWPGSYPLTSLDAKDPLLEDESVSGRLFHTPAQEEDDLVWQIKREFLLRGRDWNDLAVIAHDNATVRSLGSKLRREGVPVRYSSIARPLREEPAVQGLFAAVELGQAKYLGDQYPLWQGMDALAKASWVRERLESLLASPLVLAKPQGAPERPVRIDRLEALLKTFCSLAQVPQAPDTVDKPDTVSSSAIFRQLGDLWSAYLTWQSKTSKEEAEASGISVDDSLIEGARRQDDGQLSVDSVYFVLTVPEYIGDKLGVSTGGLENSIEQVLSSMAGSRLSDPDLQALHSALSIVSTTATGLAQLESSEPQYAFWQAWQAAGVADRWQEEALAVCLEGEEANDRLDAIMRLFQFADSSQTFSSVDECIAQVRGMQIEADSLAQVGPIDDAVTLTTPAGAAAMDTCWPIVWLPALQEGTWPNLAARDTLFGAEDLAELVLFGGIGLDQSGRVSGNSRLKATLYSEEKGFLTALTRARSQVRLSAVWNDEIVPSDFLYGFVPERFPRLSESGLADFTPVGRQAGAGSLYSGLELGPRTLVTAARSILAKWSLQAGQTIGSGSGLPPAKEDPQGQAFVSDQLASDAALTLRFLADHGLTEAQPDNWPFLYAQAEGASAHTATSPSRDLSQRQPRSPGQVTLSPSAVDKIWACPLEWAMDRQFSGPSASSVAFDYGNLIHRVAEEASRQGLDRPERGLLGVDAASDSALIASITDSMVDIYRDVAQAQPSYTDPKDAYDSRLRDRQVRTSLGHIASYFVASSRQDYAQEHNPPINVGALVDVEQEISFKASFRPADFTSVWNSTYCDCSLNDDEFFVLASALVDGFPKALTPDTQITLSGRIDRLEHRQIGEQVYQRLVDYKTGATKHGGPAIFSDLQLVCYQLGLAYAGGQIPGRQGQVAPQLLPGGSPVSQAVLFDVSLSQAPAFSHAPETVYQPALFQGHKLNTVFAPRYYNKQLSSLAKLDPLPKVAPQGLSQDQWDYIVSLQGSQGLWALTMISRVLFAAGVVLSTGHADAVFDTDHCRQKKHGECPAWQRLAGSVMEDQR